MVLRKVAPLPASFMIISIFGFILSTMYVAQYNVTWGATFGVVFICMFIASMISMERASPDSQLQAIPGAKLPKLKRFGKKRKKRRKRK